MRAERRSKDSVMEKYKKYNVVNWVMGNLICMLGIAFATKANFGLSMIAAGPYILHVYFRESFAWFTQGTAEYVYEALVLIIACIIIKKFELKYLLTFAEAIFAGFILDGWFLVLGGNAPAESLTLRIIYFVLSLIIVGLGVAFFFRTSLPLQSYDFAVVKIAERYGFSQAKTKFANDAIMLAVSLILSFALTKKLTGIGIGTVIATALNAYIISLWGKVLDKFELKDQA